MLRVWNREECDLHAIGEDIDGLSGPVAWQPNGRHIYAAQEMQDRQSVVLFEGNGLSHGSFSTAAQGDESQIKGESLWFFTLNSCAFWLVQAIDPKLQFKRAVSGEKKHSAFREIVEVLAA